MVPPFLLEAVLKRQMVLPCPLILRKGAVKAGGKLCTHRVLSIVDLGTLTSRGHFSGKAWRSLPLSLSGCHTGRTAVKCLTVPPVEALILTAIIPETDFENDQEDLSIQNADVWTSFSALKNKAGDLTTLKGLLISHATWQSTLVPTSMGPSCHNSWGAVVLWLSPRQPMIQPFQFCRINYQTHICCPASRSDYCFHHFCSFHLWGCIFCKIPLLVFQWGLRRRVS